MKQTLLITGKPSKALDSKTKNLLTVAQNTLKWPLKQYLQGRQQGLQMIWRNIMNDLKENHKKSQKIV